MVKKKYVTQYGRRNYYRYGFRRYRNVSNTYFRARVEGVPAHLFPAANDDLAGCERLRDELCRRPNGCHPALLPQAIDRFE